MPIHYARRLTAPHRTRQANWHLGIALAFVFLFLIGIAVQAYFECQKQYGDKP